MLAKDWPLIDRLAWERAKHPSGRFDRNAPLATFAAPTVRWLETCYGTFVMHLHTQAGFDETISPHDRPTAENVSSYIASLRLRLLASSISGHLNGLCQALRIFAPDRDWIWIRKLPNAPRSAEANASRKPVRPPDPAVVLREALSEFDGIVTNPLSTWNATRARNALIIAFSVLFALRRKNLGEIERGTHLLEDGSSARIAINDTMKNHTAVLFDVPDWLMPRLDKYLSGIRPVLLGKKKDEGALWLTQTGSKLTLSTMDKVFQKFGNRRLGRNIHSHLMRHAMANTIVIRNPSDHDLAAAALGHTTTQMVDQVYTRSASYELSKVWQRKLRARRRELGLED
jgi:integrase/recombinase XerD